MHRIGIICALPVFYGFDWFAHDGLEPIRLDGLIAANGGRAEIWMVSYVLVDAIG